MEYVHRILQHKVECCAMSRDLRIRRRIGSESPSGVVDDEAKRRRAEKT